KLAINELDAVVISHAHLDHCGFVPYLYKYGYDGPIYCTEPTRDLMSLLVLDAVEIGVKGQNELPFSSKEVREMIKHTIPLEYGEVADITPDIHLTLYNAGHILGSSICHFHIGEGLHNLVYTGDFKFGDTRLLEAANYEFPRAETLIMESTYGGRYDAQPKRKDAETELLNAIKETISRGGKVLIPVFSVGRSQEVMMVLESAYRMRELDVPVYIDGMIFEATAIHTSYPEYLKNHIKHRIFNGYNPFLVDAFQKVEGRKQRQEIIESPDACIIIATSGMMTGGPSVEYFRALAEDERNMICFVGYQAEGSLGRRIQNGLKEVVVEDDTGKTKGIKTRIAVQTIDGFSGHADRRQLLGYSKKINPKPKRAIIMHGEASKSMNLAMTLYDMFKFEATAPKNLDSIRLL
ncbi:MAG: beta-CASP ribonuclease aCPSF1, partial [Candidatus Altiarchaeota archaeon]|nr:beta-CASP ribonuclease aCPSF1 [Candidatus Altiarchaeota archaeon]